MKNLTSLPALFPFWALRAGLLFLLISLPHPIHAQEEVVPVLRGQVLVGEEPLGGATVVLHEVSAQASGEIDSIQAGPDGTFSLRLPRVPDHGVTAEIYLASVRYRDLLYFGPALTAPSQLDSLYLIRAFDTLSVPAGGAALPVMQRSVFLDKTDDGWEATDFFQLLQEEDRTLFSPEDGVVWSYPLPRGASEFQVGQSDLSPDAFRFDGGVFQVFSPLPPGERFFLVRYKISGDDLDIPLPGSTQLVQVLVRDPGPEVEFDALTPGAPVQLEEGNVFRSYEATSVRDGEIRGSVVAGPFEIPPEWLGILLAAILGGIGVWAYRRGASSRTAVAAGDREMSRERIVLAVAALDEDFQSRPNPTSEARERYQARRSELLGRLKSEP